MKKEYTLKNNIRKIRRGFADITQQELADATGCTRQTIVALEKNKYNPSLILAMRISKELGVSVEELFELKDANGNR
ncbi:putative transcriptional regulator [Dethiosulfatibacter aminovorans DSM 17477]|uniref:Putative transcriptional regulator n=1 Tax=Dethiosulfatibacter aminovorans DSM 17477 TaxID=1121476 RepID=A0A1M6GQX7_9FIRM|nr:helix-turn-helix transcriptional regulator [Dethiosulfatibacter aminovorans]SHJ12365.1 putative transcriptional regulator [Dethiosulfatibacter aminovorans DSM 17477]